MKAVHVIPMGSLRGPPPLAPVAISTEGPRGPCFCLTSFQHYHYDEISESCTQSPAAAASHSLHTLHTPLNMHTSSINLFFHTSFTASLSFLWPDLSFVLLFHCGTHGLISSAHMHFKRCKGSLYQVGELRKY